MLQNLRKNENSYDNNKLYLMINNKHNYNIPFPIKSSIEHVL